jgi:hypothetical protein
MAVNARCRIGAGMTASMMTPLQAQQFRLTFGLIVTM